MRATCSAAPFLSERKLFVKIVLIFGRMIEGAEGTNKGRILGNHFDLLCMDWCHGVLHIPMPLITFVTRVTTVHFSPLTSVNLKVLSLSVSGFT